MSLTTLDECLTAEEIAVLLRVPVYQVHRWTRLASNPLPCVKLAGSSKHKRFNRDAALAWAFPGPVKHEPIPPLARAVTC